MVIKSGSYRIQLYFIILAAVFAHGSGWAAADLVDCNTNLIPDICDVDPGANPNICVRPKREELAAEGATNCEEAKQVGFGARYKGSTKEAPLDGQVSCGGKEKSPSKWYKYTPVVDHILSLNLFSPTYDTVLSVHKECPSITSAEIACDDDGAGRYDSQVTLSVIRGVTYYIRVGGSSGESGNYRLTVGDNFGSEADCNLNHIPDICDLNSGFSRDCNGNNYPDDCDIAEWKGKEYIGETGAVNVINPDLDKNGYLDMCEDRNLDGVNDMCESNSNGFLWAVSAERGESFIRKTPCGRERRT